MKRTFYIVVVSAVCALLSSCVSDVVYSQFSPIPSRQWHMDSTAHFDYTIADATSTYQMIIYVRHTESYPYQNMWLFVDNNHHRDTIEFYLADDRGQWLGDKHHGWMEMPVLFENEIHFADTGRYEMTVGHGMRDSLLRGITDIGLEIRKNGQE